MQILKTFIDGAGRRHKIGDPVPKEWDKPQLAHYQRHGMVGQAEAPRREPKQRKPAAPGETKPAAPTDVTQAAPQETEALTESAADQTQDPQAS